MKRATNTTNNPKSPVKSRLTATGDTTAKHERDQEQTQLKKQLQQPKQRNEPFYCPTDETDLSIGDQQQVSLLDPRDSTEGRQQRQPPLSVKGTSSFTFAANMIGGKKAASATTNNGDQQQQVKKQQSGQKKKNILAAGDGAEDDLESNNSDTRRSGRSAKCWILIVLMSLLVALFLVVITLLFTNSLLKPDEADVCPDINQPFQASGYRLFATKTLYTTALNYLSLVPLNAAHSPAAISLLASAPASSPSTPTAASLVSISPDGQPGAGAGAETNNVPAAAAASKVSQVIHYDKSSIHKPKYFWNETLEDLHKRLTGPDFGCVAKQFHYYGRHAARYPSRRELDRMSNHFQAIKKRIDLIISPSTAAASATAPEEATSAAAGRSESTNSTSSKPACFDPLLQFSQWQMFAKPKQGNLITPLGASETQYIASRFKSIYPELFDASRTKIAIGTTGKIRTAQTAVNFARQLSNYSPDVCALRDFPSESENADTIKQNNCYKELISNHLKPELSFHKGQCSKSFDARVSFKLDQAAEADWIAQSVSRRLKLDKAGTELKYEEMKALYDLCKYETSTSGFTSIWCSLFTEQQMKFMEYIEDLRTYKKVAYGDRMQHVSACMLTKELVDHYDSYHGVNRKVPDQRAQFYFTHSQVIQKMIASMFNMATDAAYLNPKTKLKSRMVPKEREWQTSLLSPFSANIAFILYECPTIKNAAKASSSAELQAPNYNQFDVSQRHSRVLATLNEQPVALDVFKKEKSPYHLLEDFYGSSRFAETKSCDASELCPDFANSPVDGDQKSEDDDADDDGHDSA